MVRQAGRRVNHYLISALGVREGAHPRRSFLSAEAPSRGPKARQPPPMVTVLLGSFQHGGRKQT